MKRSIPVACGLIVGAAVFTGCASHQSAQPAAAVPVGATASQPYVLTTQATGTANATPDTLDVTLGVNTRAATARAALSANNTKMSALENKLKGSGVSSKDLQTAGLSIQPTYAQNDTITGYEVTDSVHATLHNLKTAGALIDAAAATLGNAVRIEQMSFSISDDSTVNARARSAAVTKAQRQARQIAQASGATLGRIHAITEQPAQQGPSTYDAGAALPAAKSIPILAGQFAVDVSVEITYDIS